MVSRWHRPVRASVAVATVLIALTTFTSSGWATLDALRSPGTPTAAAAATPTTSPAASVSVPTVSPERPAHGTLASVERHAPTSSPATVSAHAVVRQPSTPTRLAAHQPTPSAVNAASARRPTAAAVRRPAVTRTTGGAGASAPHPAPAVVRRVAVPAPPSGTRPRPTTAATPAPAAQPPATSNHPVATAAQLTAASALLRHLNPSANIAPSPNYLTSGTCTQTATGWSCDNPCISPSLTWPVVANTPSCTTYVLTAINNARQLEGVPAMILPTNWYQLTTGEQLFVVLNLERTARGLPPYLGINAALSAEAQRAALAQADPSVASGFAIGTNAQGRPAMTGSWASGFSVLAADYAWMYNDGWGGSRAATSNLDCTSAGSTGCWSHRDELLGQDPGFNPGVGLSCASAEVGVGFGVVSGAGSFVDLIELPAGTPPAMTFTWASELRYLA
ncbi:MAG: hypothetical protein ACP5OV_00860 [Acidimicrobiales bacterium]